MLITIDNLDPVKVAINNGTATYSAIGLNAGVHNVSVYYMGNIIVPDT